MRSAATLEWRLLLAIATPDGERYRALKSRHDDGRLLQDAR